jgi:integrase
VFEMARMAVYILHKTTGYTMSVFRRKTTAGYTEEYHYQFMQGGKRYSGVCIGCVSIESARAYEKNMRAKVSELEKQKSVKALVENFRVELCGDNRILLKESWSRFIIKPSGKQRTDSYSQKKETRWQALLEFMQKNYPDIQYVHEISITHAERYISHLRSLNKAPSTVNSYHKCAIEIFRRLSNSAIENPFAQIPLLREDQEPREPFTQQELETILDKAPPFIKEIFLVGLFTALREGDIATLRWSDVLWEHGIIRRKLLKTGAIVEIPIMPPLLEFLKSRQGRDAEYILPEHAAMYLENPSGISYRVKKFLEDELKIKTTKKVAGRTRAVSIKDVHSLRHTFCYFAGVAGIPLVVVQSIVGHMTPEMTAHYTAHADRATKREKLAALPLFNQLTQQTGRAELTAQLREQLIEKIRQADVSTLNRIAAILIPTTVKKSLPHSTEPGKSIQ